MLMKHLQIYAFAVEVNILCMTSLYNDFFTRGLRLLSQVNK